jgi:hypothetical protein
MGKTFRNDELAKLVEDVLAGSVVTFLIRRSPDTDGIQ